MKRIARVALALVMLVGLLGVSAGGVQAQPPPWGVELNITSSPNIGSDNVTFGVAESATGSFDAAFDAPAPPPPIQGISAYFYYPSDPVTELRKLKISYIAPGDNLTWTLRVSYIIDGPTTGNVTITWNSANITNIPSGYTSVTLRDSGDTTTLADMRAQSSYTFSVTVPDGSTSALTTFVVKAVRPPDTTAPTVISTVPAANATNVPVNTTILVTFSESMNATSAQSAFSIPSVSGTFSWAGSGTNMTFTPSVNLSPGTTYTATISTTAKDLAGNPLAQAKIWSFTTLKEVVSIVITPVNPVIKPNQTLQFTATGAYSDNTSANLTASVSWGSSNTTVASLSATTAGLAQGLVEGTTLITAALGAISNNTTLTVDSTNPMVMVYYPNGGEILKGGTAVTITWSASDANMAANPITIEYYNGTAWVPIATNEANDGTYNWTVPSLDITTAKVRVTAVDKAGNTGSDESNANFTIDSTKPTVVSVSPANGATNVPVNTTILFTFSEPMVWASVQNAFSISPTVPGSLTFVGLVKTFTPSANLTHNTTYTVTVSTNATDLAGNPLAEAKVWSFTTVKQPPAVTTSNATGITTSSATLNGILTSLGSYTPVNVSFEWGTSSTNLTQTTALQSMTTIGPFSANLTGLTVGTTYYFRAKATANGVTVYGDVLSFKTVALVSIDISPDNPRIALGRSQQFIATGTYADNSTGDVTNIATWTSSNHSVANDPVNGLATTMGKVPGITLIKATIGDISDNTTLTVGPKELETIAIAPTSASIPAGKTKDFTAIGFYSDSSNATITDNVTWLSANPTIAMIRSLGEANPGRATGMKLGETTIVAIQGSIKSNVAKVTVTSAVLDSIQITPSSASIPKGKTKQFIAIGIYSDTSNSTITTSVNWTSYNTAVATISSAGLATGRAQGTTNITASLGGVTSNIATLNVTEPVIEAIKVTPQNPTIARGTVATLPFAAMAIYSDGGMTDNTSDVTWNSSDNTTVASISPAGLATIISQGKTTITATLTTPSGVFTGSSVLTVAQPALVSVQIDDAYPASDNVVPPIAIGNTLQLYLTGTYSIGPTANLTGTAIWSSSNTAVAVISASGLVEGKAIGTANIAAIHTGLRSTVKITVTQPPAVAARAADPVGDTSATLNGFLVSLGSASNVTVSFEWGTGSGNLTQVTANQTKTSTGAFSASLSSLSANTTYYFRAKALGDGTGYSGELTFTTGKLPPTVTTGTATNITSTSATINGTLADLKGALSANVSFEWGLTTAYGNETTPVPMTSTGNFSATLGNLAPSTTYYFRAKAVGLGTSYGADNAFKTSKALVSIEITPANPAVPKGMTVQFTATGIYSEGNPGVITANWTSSDGGIATIVPATGLATGRGIGTTNITATDPVTGVFGTTTLRVLPPVLELITVTGPAQIVAGVTRQFTAMGKYSDNSSDNITTSVIWTSDNTSLASIDSTTGLVTGKNVGSTNITATQGKVSSSKFALEVTQATLISIDVTPSALVITPPQEKQFKAVGIYSDGRMDDITTRVTWASSDNTVATITTGGSAKGLAAGTTNITATLGAIPGRTTLIVRVDLTAITISANVTAIPAGRAERFTAIGTYTGGLTADITKQVNWVSSNLTTARINAAGVATSFASGATAITASLGGIPSNTIILTVGDPVLAAIQIRPVNPSVTLVSGSNQTLQFTATGIYSGGTTADNTTDATWRSSNNTTVASISPTGLVTIIGQGKTTITAVLLTASHSTELTVLPDKMSPVVTLTSPTEGLLLSAKSLVVSGRVDDTSANTTAIVNGVSFPVTLDPRTGDFSQVVPLKSGSNSIQVRAIDGVGNTGASGTLTVVVDVEKVKPGITITKPSPLERLTNLRPLTVEGTITGNVTSATLIFNGVSTGVRVVGGGFSANVSLSDGVNIIVVNAYTAGHLGDADYLGTSGVIVVTLDRDVPRVIINSPVSGTITSVRLSEVSGTVNDPWVTSVALTVNNKPQSVTVVKGVFSQSVTLQPGLNTITVEATDEAGNKSSVTSTVTLDTSVPGVTITAPTNQLLTNTAAQIVTGNVTDLSITTANLTLNGTVQEIPVAPDGSFSQAITLTPGLNTIEVTAADSAVPPNTGTSGVVNVRLDNIAPVIIVGLSNPTESILITVTSNETLEGLPRVKITGLTSESVNMTLADVNKWTGSYGSETAPIAIGEYSVTVTGTDEAGNTATVTATFAKKTIDVSGIEPTTVTTPTTTLKVETNGAVSDADISVTQHIDNPSGNVGNPEGVAAEVGVFVEIVAPPELSDNLKQIYIRVDYDPAELPAGTDESTLKLYLWDVTLGIWQVVPDSSVNTTAHYIYGTVDHLSKYGGFGKPKAPPAVAEVVVPAVPAGGITITPSLGGLSAAPSLRVDGNGIVQETVQVKTLDGKASFNIARGVKLLDARGSALIAISASGVTSPPAPPAERAVISAYDFGPAGATFEPAITLTISYDPAVLLTKGVAENELYLAYWDGSQWLALKSTVNSAAKTVSAAISHFTQFAVIGKLPVLLPAPPVTPVAPPTPPAPPPAPAAFATTALTISPSEVSIGESVTISVLVTNTGELSGSYEVVLKIDNVAVATKDVTLAGGASQTVTFTTARDASGTYTVTINDLSGAFTVKKVEVIIPPPVKPTNWGLIGGIIAGLVVVGLLVYFFVWRRRGTLKPS